MMAKKKSKVELEPGDFLGNTACICGRSSDAMSVYQSVDSKELNGYCRSGFCERESGYISPKELEEEGFTLDSMEVSHSAGKPVRTDFSDIEALNFRGWKERMVTKTVCEKYGVRSEEVDGEPVAHYYPVTKKGKVVGYRKRVFPKKIFAEGDCKSSNEMFGQNVFEKGQKYLVVTTGEMDAMSMAQVLRQEKNGQVYWTPCVSVINGDDSILTQFKANLEWLNSFEKVILIFDADDSAQSFVDEAAKLLSPGKAYIGKLPSGCKDANKALMDGVSSQLKQTFWKAEPFSRVDVLHLNQMWDDFENEDNNVKIPFPDSWSTLNAMMNGGGEKGEITVVGALTSIGKSSLINSIVYNLIENTDFKVGTMYLEGTKREVVRDLLSLDAGINLRQSDRSEIDMGGLKKRFFENLAKKDQFVYVDHQGSISTDEIFDKMNYLAKSEECDVIVFDPIQAGVNSSDNGAIIDFMDTLLKFAKETDTYVIAVSHMRKPDSDDPHNVSEYSLMGSSSINQIAFNTILASRDKMNEDPIIKNATKLQLVKCRRTGNTGDAGWLRYDFKTTHIYATANPYDEAERTLDEHGQEDEGFTIEGESF